MEAACSAEYWAETIIINNRSILICENLNLTLQRSKCTYQHQQQQRRNFLTTERNVMIPTYFRFGWNLTKKTAVRIIVYNALLAAIITGNTLAQETGTSADQPGAVESTCPTPYIKVIKPRVAQVGQTVTIRGRRFGTQEGQVSFSGSVAELLPCGQTTGLKLWCRRVSEPATCLSPGRAKPAATPDISKSENLKKRNNFYCVLCFICRVRIVLCFCQKGIRVCS